MDVINKAIASKKSITEPVSIVEKPAAEVNIMPTPTASEAKEIAALKEELEEEGKLPVRVVKTYCNGEALPEVPKLIPTGTLFDKIICDRFTTPKQLDDYLTKFQEEMPDEDFEAGGFTRKCADIVAGDPGAGKTTNLCTLAAKAKIFARRELGKEIKVSFISAEMRESEWAKELRDSELLRELQVTFMLDYVGYTNYEDILWEALADGDIIILDSFPATIDHIRMNPKEKRSEKAITADFIRKILKSVSKHDNNVQVINQATKDGNYKGGTILPHMLSSLSFVRLDGENRYWEYSKNRNNGKVKRRAYFGRNEGRDIIFDDDLYESTYEQKIDKKSSMEDVIEMLKADNDKNIKKDVDKNIIDAQDNIQDMTSTSSDKEEVVEETVSPEVEEVLAAVEETATSYEEPDEEDSGEDGEEEHFDEDEKATLNTNAIYTKVSSKTTEAFIL